MNFAKVMQWVSGAAALMNVAWAAFQPSIPVDVHVPWYVTGGIAVANAIVHVLPGGALSPFGGGK